MSNSLKIALLLTFTALAIPGLAAAKPKYRQVEPSPRHETQYQPDYRDNRRDDYQDNRRIDYSDVGVHDRVHEAIDEVLGERGQRVVVAVRNGVVTLSGQVESQQDRRLAHDVAHEIDGVRSVGYRRLYVAQYAQRHY